MIIKGKNGMYDRQECPKCGQMDKQDYLELAETATGIEWVHPSSSKRCKTPEMTAAHIVNKLVGTMILLGLGAYFAVVLLGN